MVRAMRFSLWREALLDIGRFDVRSLALFRILVGAVAFRDQLGRFAEAEAFYSDCGVLPRQLFRVLPLNDFDRYFSLHLLGGSIAHELLAGATCSDVPAGQAFCGR